MDPRRASDQVRNIITGASQELSTAIEKFLKALFDVTNKLNEENRKRYKTALDTLNTVPLVTPEDAKALERLRTEVTSFSKGIDKRIKKTNDIAYDLVEQARENISHRLEDKPVSQIPKLKRGRNHS